MSEKKRASNAKWDREHMRTVGCRLRIEQADRLRAICIAQGTTPTAVIRAAVDEYMERYRDLLPDDRTDEE